MNILFATDGSENSFTAGRLIASLPLPAGTRITVLSAIAAHYWLDTPLPAEVMADEEAAALQTAEAAARLIHGEDRQVAVRVRSQDPAAAILDQAREDAVDLIVVGSHGKGAVHRFLIGSVSERVARHAPCSVLVVRDRGLDRGPAPRRVAIGVDSSPASEDAIDVFSWLPLPKEVELRLIHVLHLGSTALPAPLVPGLLSASMMKQYDQEYRTAGERITRHCHDRLDRIGREATTELRWGPPAAELVAATRAWDADLLVVGAANHSPLGRLFLGSVSASVLHHAPCSVLIARKGVR